MIRLAVPLAVLWSTATAAEPDWRAVQEEAVAALAGYLRTDTYNPPGRTVESVRYLQALLEPEGIEAEILDAGDGRLNLLARIPGDGSGPKPLILMHHMDIVPADPELWTHPPLGGKSADGYLWGRGAIDMKGMGILELMAFIQVKRSGMALDRDLVYLAVADEETGGARGAVWMVENYWDRLDPEYVWDEGLTGTDGLFTDDGVVWGISVAEKKVFWLRLVADGTAGHASQPHDDNPVDLVTTALARLAAHPFPADRNPVVAEIFARLGEPVANKYTNAIQRNTCSLTTLKAGVGDPPKVNVIPSTAEATIDCRLLPDADPRAVLEQLIAIMGREPFEAGRMRLEILAEPDRTGITTSFDSDLFRAMRDIAQEARPGSIAVPILSPWGTDSPNFRKRGVKAYGFIPIIVGPGELARMHGIDERISHDNVGLGVRMVYRIIERFAAVR